MENQATASSATAPTLAEVFAALGRSSVVQDTVRRLQERGAKRGDGQDYDRHAVYAVIRGASQNAEVTAAFLEAVEAEAQRRADLKARLQDVAAKVTA